MYAMKVSGALALVRKLIVQEQVLVSSYNFLGNDRYYDVESSSSFIFDHIAQKASSVESYSVESRHIDLVKTLSKSMSIHAREHFPSSTFSVCPTSSDSSIAISLVANKYSPSNFWNGRWRSTYFLDPSSSTLSGSIKVDVHYYEDGNVRLTTSKPIPSVSVAGSATGSEVIKQVAQIEKKYQEELNRSFTALSEGTFKGLRRQLPVTRQKVEWEKVGGYRLGQDIGGAYEKIIGNDP
ncbi:F-actin-capping protein subunit alpha [Physcia stellaris]|nr:F-actin-capping protein subunit alpha [Physcia stellaris]